MSENNSEVNVAAEQDGKNAPGALSENNPANSTDLPGAYLANLAMDGTSVMEFSFVDNTKYSQEIISGARAAFNLEKLEALKASKDFTGFLAEVKTQIQAQCHADQALRRHYEMSCVQFQFNTGMILNIVEPTFKKKGEFMTWLRDNFKDYQLRYFQQARQLADIGDFALTHAAAGKNRLLALESLRKVEKREECEALFVDHPLPDITEDEDGKQLKSHIDSVITYHRLANAGVGLATFDQAALIASYNNEALGVRTAEKMQEWLLQHPEDQRPALFDQYVQDKGQYPTEHPYNQAPKASLNKLMADLKWTCENVNINDETWIGEQKKVLEIDSLIAAQSFIGQLIDKLRTLGSAAAQAA